MEVKQFTDDYLADVLEMHYALTQFHKPHSLMQFKFNKSRAEYDSEVVEAIKDGANIILLMDKAKCIGLLKWDAKERPDNVTVPDIQWLYIQEDYRGNGGGTLLLNEAIRQMRALCPKAPGYIISAEYWNENAWRLYENVGFEPQAIRLYFKA